MSDKKVKVLVVEDNLMNVRLLTAYLEEAGFEVMHAADGSIGLEKTVLHRDIDIILLDRMMPNMDGIDALLRFKRSPISAHIPIIMLTAALSPKQISEAKITGAYGCLPKPYDRDKIIKMVNEALQGPKKQGF